MKNKRGDGLKKLALQKKEITAKKINEAIEKIKRSKNTDFNFSTIAKEAQVTRATLYNNKEIRERIFELKAIYGKNAIPVIKPSKDVLQNKDNKIRALYKEIKKLRDDKEKLIEQLLNYHDLELEIERLKNLLQNKNILDMKSFKK